MFRDKEPQVQVQLMPLQHFQAQEALWDSAPISNSNQSDSLGGQSALSLHLSLLNICLFVWLFQVLVVALRTFSCGMQDPLVAAYELLVVARGT